MSDVETYRGRLIPVDREGKSIDEWIKDFTGKSEYPNYFSSWLEYFREWLWELDRSKEDSYHYDRNSDTLYRVERTKLDPEGFTIYELREDGSVDFAVSFYNGGASFGEVMEEILEEIP